MHDERDLEIERLVVDVARPVIRRVLLRYTRANAVLQPHEADDVEATVTLRLVAKLHAAAADPSEAVARLEDYVARLTYNAVNDVLRVRHPERTRFKNRLRYVMTHDPRLALWWTLDGLACGLAEASGKADVLTELPLRPERMTAPMTDRARVADAVLAILRASARPVLFDALVRGMASLWNVGEARAVEDGPRVVAVPEAAIVRFETRELLRVLWREIQLLPPLQRKALLLNLRERDTVNVVSLFVLTGIALPGEIAGAMGMTMKELEAIWMDLPFDDLRIAAMMGLTRQQVINLRKSARARLGRRVSS
jgi:hypothetical protein